MGIFHLAPIGRSPGAVTSALAYIKKNQDDTDKIHYRRRDNEDTVQAVVLFPSRDVASGATSEEDTLDNQYGVTTLRKATTPGKKGVIHWVRKFLEEEDFLPSGGKLYSWPVEMGNYEDCFEAVAKATLALGEPGSTGKHLWANLTGGNNIVNAALVEVSALSGLIARLYYTFLTNEHNRRYLRPPSKEKTVFSYYVIDPPKTDLHQAYYAVLEVLAKQSNWCLDSELLKLLQSHPEYYQYFQHVALQAFQREFLNRMDGYEVQRPNQGSHECKIADKGQEILERLKSPLYRALTLRGQLPDTEFIEQCKQELNSPEKIVYKVP